MRHQDMSSMKLGTEEAEAIQARILARVSKNSPVINRTETHNSLDILEENSKLLRASKAFDTLFAVR